MGKILSISLTDYEYNTVLRDFKGNKSRRIGELILIGLDSELGESISWKQRLAESRGIINEKDQEINRLKLLVGSLKERLERRKPKSEKAIEQFQKERGIVRIECKYCNALYNSINKLCPYCKRPNPNPHTSPTSNTPNKAAQNTSLTTSGSLTTTSEGNK